MLTDSLEEHSTFQTKTFPQAAMFSDLSVTAIYTCESVIIVS